MNPCLNNYVGHHTLNVLVDCDEFFWSLGTDKALKIKFDFSYLLVTHIGKFKGK